MCMYLCMCGGNQTDNVSQLDGGDKGRLWVFRWCVHQWRGGEVYILGEVRVKSGGTQFLTPAVTQNITQKVRPRTLQHESVFDFAALLNFLFLSSLTFQISAQSIMEAAICTLVTQFKTYAGKDGSASTLSKEEFHKLVTSQLPNYVKVNLRSSS